MNQQESIKMTLQQKQSVFAKNVAILINHIYDNGHCVTFADAYRSPEAAALNAKDGKGIADSLHCKRLAIDLNLFDMGGKYLTEKSDWECFGLYWESLHPMNRWGGFFVEKYKGHIVDSNHLEMQDL